MSYPTPTELWAMSPDDFNQWRRENDLQRLFAGFGRALPHFEEWLTANALTVDFMLATDNPGQFFYWDTATYCIKTVKQLTEPYLLEAGITQRVTYFFVPVHDARHERQIQAIQQVEGENEQVERLRFTPYFAWVREKHRLQNPIKTKYSGELSTFHYTSGTAPDVPEACNWSIAPGIQVLKLGGTTIENWATLQDRNLDFVNLDFLEVTGKYTWNEEKQIFFSTCNHLTIRNVVANFTKFYRCEVSDLKAFDSRLYWVEFYECNLYQAYFENASLSNLIIEECSASNFSFNRVEVDNIVYSPPRRERPLGTVRTYETVSANYKRFRILYQANGLRQEASEAYFQERYYEWRHDLATLELWRSFRYLWTVNPEYGLSALKANFSKLLTGVADGIAYVLWGFGERPLRILSSAGLVLLFYAAVYFFSDIGKLHGNFVNSLYFSIVTFTTLGFGDITPSESSGYKLIVGSEALVGAFCVGLLVAGFANKSRY